MTDTKPTTAKRNRSRVENGATFVVANATSAWARRFKGLISTYSNHIGGNPTPPQQALIRRIASLDIECERMEGDLAEGKPIDLDLLNRLAGGQRRLLQQLGFKASARPSDRNPLLDHFSKPAARKATA